MRVVFQGTMAGSVLNYVGYGLFGLLLAVLWSDNGADVGPAAAILVLLPLFVARWAYEQYAEQQRAYDRTVRTLIAAVETKDLYTRGHSERVSAGVGADRPRDRHARGPRQLVALRRHAARRRQARRADARAAEDRAA